MTSEAEVAARILSTCRTFAIVGISPLPRRPSHRVAAFLQRAGYRVIPINPACPSVLGEVCYPDLASVPAMEGIEVVDVFRRSELAGVHVDEAIAAGAKAVWLQLGVIDEAAIGRARAAGLDAVMDRCPAMDYPRLFGPTDGTWPPRRLGS